METIGMIPCSPGTDLEVARSIWAHAADEVEVCGLQPLHCFGLLYG